MKLRERLVVLGLLYCIIPFAAKAQCDNESRIITYDSIFTGTGNDIYEFIFPKFDASLGTLTAVEFQTVVTVHYGFNLENTDYSSTNNYRVRVSRLDEFYHPDFLSIPLTIENDKTYGPFRLGPNDGVYGSGKDYVSVDPVFPYQNDTIIKRSFNTADFLGLGTVSMEYWTNTFSATMGGVNNIKTEKANDTMHVTISYIYCKESALPADFSYFSARKEGSNISLNWQVENEEDGRIYSIEKSTDGRNFESIKNIPSRPGGNLQAGYRTVHTPASGDNGKMIFRIKQINPDGTEKLSDVRVVNLGGKGMESLKLFPNPAVSQISVLFNSNSDRNDWTLEVFSINGKLVERRTVKRKLLETIHFDNKYSKGMYIVKAGNIATGEITTERFIIH